MTDISKHPLLKACYEACLAVEKLGCGPDQADAISRVSDMMRPIEALVDGLSAAESRAQEAETKLRAAEAIKSERDAALAQVGVLERKIKETMFEAIGQCSALRDAIRWRPIEELEPVTGDRVFVTYTTPKGVWAADIHWDSVAASDPNITHGILLPHPAPIDLPVLMDTSATAQQFVARIERGALESFIAECSLRGFFYPHFDDDEISAAILGEKEKNQ